MTLSSIKGRGSILRFMVMTDLTLDAQGNYKRPANFTAAALTLPEVTTSDMPITVASQTNETPTMYGSTAPGAGEQWADPEPGEASWTTTFDGVVQPTETARAAMQAARTAMKQRKIVWVERTPNGETTAEGGAGFISSGALPVPADAPETFNFTVTGKGKLWDDTSVAPTAA